VRRDARTMGSTPRSGRGRRGLPVLTIVALLVSGCGLIPHRTSDPMIDGVVIGPDIPCVGGEITSLGCSRLDAAVRAELDREYPGHAAVSSVTLHKDGTTIGPNGEVIVHTTGVPWWSFVVELADGTSHAVGVGCGVDVTPDMDCLASPAP